MRIEEKYTTKKEFVNGHKISYIILMNIARVLDKPKDMTNHSKRQAFFRLKDDLPYISLLSWYLVVA